MNRPILLLAQGFGVGRLPKAPGTFGSVAGLLWTALLLQTGNLSYYLMGASLAAAASVWLSGRAEAILGQKDPDSVVVDEIVALPFCLLPVVWFHWHGPAGFLAVTAFTGKDWLFVLAAFILFRFFDIIKPFPVYQSQRLPGGWGITVDDLLAAAYTALLLFAAIRFGRL